MEIAHLIPHIEALIFASERPLTGMEITEYVNNAFGFMEDKVVLDQVESALEGITEKYQSDFYPFQAVQSGGGWQFLTKKDYHKTVAQLNGDKFMKRLSGASLETLAIVAYKQPITKGEIESIRGVNSDYSVQKLLEKELIVISGRNEKLPGHPLVYAVSKNFMDYFGLNSTEDLPKIREVLAEEIAAQTYVNEVQATAAEPDHGVINEMSEHVAEAEMETTAVTEELIVTEEITLDEGETTGEETNDATENETAADAVTDEADVLVNDGAEPGTPEDPAIEKDEAQQPEA